MSVLNRYATPVPEGYDGESVNLCEDCFSDHPQHDELEWLESKASWHGCDGDDCPLSEDEEAEEGDLDGE